MHDCSTREHTAVFGGLSPAAAPCCVNGHGMAACVPSIKVREASAALSPASRVCAGTCMRVRGACRPSGVRVCTMCNRVAAGVPCQLAYQALPTEDGWNDR